MRSLETEGEPSGTNRMGIAVAAADVVADEEAQRADEARVFAQLDERRSAPLRPPALVVDRLLQGGDPALQHLLRRRSIELPSLGLTSHWQLSD